MIDQILAAGNLIQEELHCPAAWKTYLCGSRKRGGTRKWTRPFSLKSAGNWKHHRNERVFLHRGANSWEPRI